MWNSFFKSNSSNYNFVLKVVRYNTDIVQDTNTKYNNTKYNNTKYNNTKYNNTKYNKLTFLKTKTTGFNLNFYTVWPKSDLLVFYNI